MISYFNYGHGSKERETGCKPESESSAVCVSQALNLDLASKYNEKQSPAAEFNTGKIFSIAIGVILVLGAVITAIFFLVTGQSRLSAFDLYRLSDSQAALQSYLFPQTGETIADTSDIALVEDYLTEVEFQNYTVQVGDTISGVAYKFGLNSIGTLIAVNDIKNVKKLQIGTNLVIPSLDGLFHTVQSGETLATIAEKYKLSVNNILDVNDLTSETISIGEKIFIPGARLSNFQLKKAMGELFIYPVSGRITSPFGYRIDPITGGKSFHTGVDIANKMGTGIKAIMDGRVSDVGYNKIYGNYIIITHDGGYQSLYGHLSAVLVKRGVYVTQGAKIAKMGSTGRSTGSHLHLSIYKNGKLINPLSVLEN